MNFGLSRVSGEYIWYLHSDDRLHGNNTIENVSKYLDGSETHWLIGNCNIINSEGKTIGSFVLPKEHFSNLIKYNCIPHASTVVKTELIRGVSGFSEELDYAMDYDLWLKLKKIHPPHFTEEILADFRQHDFSFSTANPLPVHIEDFKVRLRHSKYNFQKIKFFFRFFILYLFIKLPVISFCYKKFKTKLSTTR